MIQRIIPSSGKKIPLIGLGTWQTFDVSDIYYPELTNVLNELHTAGGKLIDSSPMYGRSEKVIGDITSMMNTRDDFFYATKVWTRGKKEGISQMQSSMQKMKRKTIDLMQIHNLTDWKIHLPVLQDWKERGIINYIGITHYTDSMHEALETIFTNEKIDFVQFNFSIDSTNAEKRLLKAASDQGVATLINRPFGEGKLFNKVKMKELPQWSIEAGIETWSVFFLKYIISNPAVTCVIPATSDPKHAIENCKAGNGNILNEETRKRMFDLING
jgi:diketogulonate reductase-like aldo/keto reductase